MSHRFIRPMLACAIVFVLAGCQSGSDADRINAALPPSAEFLGAKDSLLAAGKPQGLDLQALDAELDARMEQRAAVCAGGFRPGLFDGDAAIRDKLTNKECFAAADESLLEWLGLRRVALALDAPPLRPMPTSLATIETAGSARNLVFAQRAGVAIGANARKTQVFDIGTGALIAQHDRTSSGALSANGRVYVAQDGEGLQLRDAESDALLLTLHGASARGFSFLGEGGALAAVMDDAAGKHRLEYLDFHTGRRTPVAMDGFLGGTIVTLPGDGSRFLAYDYGQLVELQRVDGPEGAHVEVLRKSPITATPSRGRMSLTADGKLLPALSPQRLEVIDLSSMTTRGITLAPLRPLDVVPTPDPDKLLVTVLPPGQIKTQAYLYSLGARTLAQVDTTRAWGAITWLPTLKRNAMVDNSRLVPLDAIPAGEAEDANLVIERAMQAAGTAMTPLAGSPTTTSVSADRMQALRQEAIERSIRENNLPPAEAARLREWVGKTGAKSAPRVGPAVSPFSNAGGILRIPADADVRGVGVYESAEGSHGTAKARTPGAVRVFVSRSKRPIVLVLSSYEPVNWILQLQDGAKVSNVLLSSHHGSQAFGAGDARIDSIGTQYAYKRGSPDFDALDAQVQRFTGKRIGSFQGAYSGTSFSLGY